MRALIAETGGRQSPVGYLLALVALCLQLAAPVLLAPLVSSADRDGFATFLRLHALCLGGDAAQKPPEAPAPDRPDQTGHHGGACCFLHGTTGSALLPPLAVQPVAFRFSAVSFPPRANTEIAARLAATPRARAPPGEA